MKAKLILLMISIGCSPAICTFGQNIDCTASTKLACEFPVSASQLGVLSIGGSQFFTAAQQQAQPINASIAAQLTQLPIPSATVGTVTIQEKGVEGGVPFANLGPILTDRPDTVGKRHFFLGFSYQHFNFNSADGVSLASLPVAVEFSQPSPFAPNDIQTFYGSVQNNIRFSLDQYVGIATLGLTKTIDVSVVVPVNSVNLSVTSSNFDVFYFDSNSTSYTDKSPNQGKTISTTGSATGLGDVSVSLKKLLLGGEGTRAALAAGATARFATGDEFNYLGSGAFGGDIFGLFEFRARIAPHLKIAYQWNANSALLFNTLTKANVQLPGGLQYAAGADARLNRHFTVGFDLLGSQFVNSPSFTLSTAGLPSGSTNPGGVNPIPTEFTSVNPLNNTYTTANVSGGLKWAPSKTVLFYANVLKQVNNVGLRSDLVPTFGIAFKR